VEALPRLGCRAERQRVEEDLIGRGAVKARVRAPAIVQLDDRTPTGLKFGRFGTGGTPGLGVR
jgi:hypothetical protein